MRSGRLRGVVVGSGILVASTAILLSRMRADFQRHGHLRRRTATVMYAAYAAHALATVTAWTRMDPRLSAQPARAIGAPLMTAGAILCLSGMRRFATPGQVSGTAGGPLVTDGVYRISRNPQYTGYLLLLTGAAIARSSSLALILHATVPATFADPLVDQR